MIKKIGLSLILIFCCVGIIGSLITGRWLNIVIGLVIAFTLILLVELWEGCKEL